jgi:hypothetical protein
MSAPFADVGLAGVTARVGLAYLRMIRAQVGKRDLKPSILIGISVGRLDGLEFGVLRLALLSLNSAVLGGVTSDAWLKEVLYHEMMGQTYRRCFYSAYKGTRRDPRVTNRGVIPRASSKGDIDSRTSDI